MNTSIGIFNKTGTQLAAFTFNAFWPDTTSTLCDNSNSGDPTVIYDPIADRWIVADFAFAGAGTTPPFYECIAVSKTSDPVAGGWYLYPIRTDDTLHPWFADYPKMGIWPDGLYMTANMFDSSDVFKEVRVWAFNRGDLEAGLTVRNRVVDLASTAYFSLLPSNMRTAAGTPPVGRENLLVSESRTLFSFEVWKFHVDYDGGGTTFTGPTNVSQTTYTVAPTTVPSPGNALDSLRERLMMQAQYSNIGGAESLWVNHTVRTAGSPAPVGIQWGQINVTGGTVATTPVQQQIYGDVGERRAQSLDGQPRRRQERRHGARLQRANATTNPDIRYAGRLAGDPLNTARRRDDDAPDGVTLGTQSGSCGATCIRWGDYSAMTLDPDGCTFWYTKEYYETTGLNWQTRIGSFSYPSARHASTDRAGPPAPGAPPTQRDTHQGRRSGARPELGGRAGHDRTQPGPAEQAGAHRRSTRQPRSDTLLGARGVASQTGASCGAGGARHDATTAPKRPGRTAGSAANSRGRATYAGNGVYGGSSGSNSLTVNKAAATLTIVPASLHRNYDGSPKPVTVTASPPGLSGVSVTYNGSAVAPTRRQLRRRGVARERELRGAERHGNPQDRGQDAAEHEDRQRPVRPEEEPESGVQVSLDRSRVAVPVQARPQGLARLPFAGVVQEAQSRPTHVPGQGDRPRGERRPHAGDAILARPPLARDAPDLLQDRLEQAERREDMGACERASAVGALRC